MIVACLRRLQEHEPQLRALSLDKGFWRPAVYEELSRTLTLVVIPKKGKRTVNEQAREQACEFVDACNQHVAIESAMNRCRASRHAAGLLIWC